jgi:hypothetical protein
LGARRAARIHARALITKKQGLSAPGTTTYSGGAMLAMPERAKIQAGKRTLTLRIVHF